MPNHSAPADVAAIDGFDAAPIDAPLLYDHASDTSDAWIDASPVILVNDAVDLTVDARARTFEAINACDPDGVTDLRDASDGFFGAIHVEP